MRKLNSKMKVANTTTFKVPYDLENNSTEKFHKLSKIRLLPKL